MPPLVGIRLPASAQQMATAPTASAQPTMASGAQPPSACANAAGVVKMPAPTIMLKMPAARLHGPRARTKPRSR
jgi:hypothetical protein